MGSFTITMKSHPRNIPTPDDLPKCVCGGAFKLKDLYTKKGVLWLTSAVCSECKEYFCGHDLNDLYRAIPSGQKARAKDNSSFKQ